MCKTGIKRPKPLQFCWLFGIHGIHPSRQPGSPWGLGTHQRAAGARPQQPAIQAPWLWKPPWLWMWTSLNILNIQWMEEILHLLVDGSHYIITPWITMFHRNPNGYQLVQDFAAIPWFHGEKRWKKVVTPSTAELGSTTFPVQMAQRGRPTRVAG